jgi:hypothetical protein
VRLPRTAIERHWREQRLSEPVRGAHVAGRYHFTLPQPLFGEPGGERTRRAERVVPGLDVERVHEAPNELEIAWGLIPHDPL